MDTDTERARAARRELCRRCLQPRLNCYCGAIAPQQSRANWIFLQHPGEARNPIGTARMAHLSLPGSHLFCGVDFSRDDRLRTLLEKAARPAVLFPVEGARVLGRAEGGREPLTLIVLDGTWGQARKLWKVNDFLRALPAYRLEPGQPSRYRIRAEPAAHCVSTIEAVAAALQALDGQDREAMLAPFLDLVARQAGFGQAPERSPRRRMRPPKGLHLPQAVARDRRAALLIHVEANGFPQSWRDRPPGELVELRALRWRDASSFAALSLPAQRGPRFHELGLSRADEASAIPPGEMRARWLAFARPGDVWATWGRFPLDLMGRAGLRPLCEGIDVKHWCSSLLGRSPGTLEHACDLLGMAPPPVRLIRRADQQLWRLARVFELLLSQARPSADDIHLDGNALRTGPAQDPRLPHAGTELPSMVTSRAEEIWP